jgi:glycosyltransferase involved in cell wall biosynthesis
VFLAVQPLFGAEMKFAIILPVYNEAPTLEKVVNRLSEFKDGDVVVVDDGSTDATPSVLERIRVHSILRHDVNQGYGRSLMDGFDYVKNHGYEYCVTMDADEQHEPSFIPCFLDKLSRFDIVSGSRYLNPLLSEDVPPPERLEVNRIITERLSELTPYKLTDSFCGFKGYRVDGLKKLHLTETNYGFPIQFWLQAAKAGLTVNECAVPLIYKDYSRNFNNQFANRDERLTHYLEVMEREAKSLGLTPR